MLPCEFAMYPQFDRRRLLIKPLAEREHDLSHDHLLDLDAEPEPFGTGT